MHREATQPHLEDSGIYRTRWWTRRQSTMELPLRRRPRKPAATPWLLHPPHEQESPGRPVPYQEDEGPVHRHADPARGSGFGLHHDGGGRGRLGAGFVHRHEGLVDHVPDVQALGVPRETRPPVHAGEVGAGAVEGVGHPHELEGLSEPELGLELERRQVERNGAELEARQNPVYAGGVQGGQRDPPPESAPTPERTPTPAPTPEPQEPQPEPDQSQEQASSACMAYDANGNGGIDASEAVAATIDYGNGVISPELLDQLLSRCR